jgi:hypothetical protein
MFGDAPFGSAPFAAWGDQTIVRYLSITATAVEGFNLSQPFRRLSDAATATDSLTSRLGAILSDSATASEVLGGYASLLVALADEAEASEALQVALQALISDSATASEALTTLYTQTGQLLDRALASDPLLSYLQATELLFVTAVATELLRSGFSAHLVDSALASESLVGLMRAVALTLDEATAADALVDSLRIIGTLSDEADATEALTSLQTLLAALESGATAAVVLTIGGDQYTAWVLNTENIAVTQYSNYPFNSFAELNGKYYGAASDGMYLLEGDDDAGTPIQAYFRAPLTDFGFAGLKRLHDIALGYTASGDLVFKAVVISPNGSKEEHWYRLEQRPTEALRENRVPVGRGLKSVYWQYELHNIDGADFQIETVRMWPMGLSRKVR